MKTEKISGYFDVRKYDKKVKRKDRKLIADGENFTFSTSYPIAELPAMFKSEDGKPDEFVKLYSSRDEVRAAEAEKRQAVFDRASVKFKISAAKTYWFDKFGKSTNRPTNEELDNSNFEVQIEFRRRAKNPDDDKSPSGYWVNAIMFRKVDENPFAGEAFEEAPEDAPEPEPSPAPQTQEKNDDLPF